MNGFPLTGFGTTQFWYGSTKESFACALEAVEKYGITMIDTAEMYGDGVCEDVCGQIAGTLGRHRLYLVDKILPWNADEKRMRKSLEKSLDRLHTDYIDLYLLHWREDADLEFVSEQMEQFCKEGKIRHWGVSNFDVHDMEDLLKCRYGRGCYANQIYYSLDKRGAEFDLLPYLKEHGIHAMAYSSLDERAVRNRITAVNEIHDILAKENISVEKLMLEYVKAHDVCALFQTRTRKHLKADLEPLDFDISQYLETIAHVLPAPVSKVPLEKR